MHSQHIKAGRAEARDELQRHRRGTGAEAKLEPVPPQDAAACYRF